MEVENISHQEKQHQMVNTASTQYDESTREKTLKKQSTSETTRSDHIDIPTDVIMSNILVRIPPQILYHSFRYVSKQWNSFLLSTPHFAHQNLLYSKPKLLLHYPENRPPRKPLPLNGVTFDMDENGEVVPIGTIPLPLCPKDGGGGVIIIDSCKGLLLIKTGTTLHLVNPITNKLFSFPPCYASCSHESCFIFLVFDSSSNLFKVIHVYYRRYSYEIWSFGVDNAWREVPTLHPDDRRICCFFANLSKETVIIKEIIHWCHPRGHCVVSMDASNETDHVIPTPHPGHYRILEMRGYLSCAAIEESTREINIWILKDYKREEWIHWHCIASSSLTCLPQVGRVFGFLTMNNGNTILFSTHLTSMQMDQQLYSYDITSGRLKKLNLIMDFCQELLVHQDSLISWEAPDKLHST